MDEFRDSGFWILPLHSVLILFWVPECTFFKKIKESKMFLKCKINHNFFSSQTWGSQTGGSGGRGPSHGKIPTFSRFFYWERPLVFFNRWVISTSRTDHSCVYAVFVSWQSKYYDPLWLRYMQLYKMPLCNQTRCWTFGWDEGLPEMTPICHLQPWCVSPWWCRSNQKI